MKKYTGLLVFAASVAMSLGASMASMAATGWVQEGSKWYYYDTNGNKAKEGWRKVDGKQYCFDSNGAMRVGWYEDGDDIYYLGGQDDGNMKTGWLCLSYNEDDKPTDGEVSDYSSSAGYGAEWFYFQTNGKATRATDGEYAEKSINGQKYCFDEDGVMQHGWISVTDAQSNDSTGISKFKYYGDENSGIMAKGWLQLSEHPSDSDDMDEISGDDDKPNEGETFWYYFDSNGTPRYLKQNAGSVSNATSKINGDSYFFDRYGCMRSGLIGLDGVASDTVSVYFGEADGDGKMRTGRQTNVREENGDVNTFYFNTSGGNKGAGYNGEKDDYLYCNGKLLKAENGATYQVFEVDNKVYLVNESGKVQTSNKCYKIDGEYRYEYDHGAIYEVDDEKERISEVTSGEESMPEISYSETYSL